MPMEMTPNAVPRLRTNHLVTFAAEQLWKPEFAPNEMTPTNMSRKIAKELARGRSRKPTPASAAPMIIMILGPHRSMKMPVIGL